MHELPIGQFRSADWTEVREIYEQGLLTRNAMFETQAPDYDSWIMKFHSHLFWVVDVTIYVHNAAAGKGVGTYWALYASIFPENTASIKKWMAISCVFSVVITSIDCKVDL